MRLHDCMYECIFADFVASGVDRGRFCCGVLGGVQVMPKYINEFHYLKTEDGESGSVFTLGVGFCMSCPTPVIEF